MRSRAPKPGHSMSAILLRATQVVTCPLVLPAVVFVAPDSAFRNALVENAGLIVGGLLVPFYTATALLEGDASASRRGQ